MGDHPHSHHQFLLHHHQNQQPHQPPARRPPQSRLGAPRGGGGGEIVEVQGGHIVRSTGRKDRHSKVCTAKGPRDRRVRLSAHTAIQFYDVQDRLGYDRPSKAVDWLMKNAKAAIDELAELPAWHPTATTVPSASNQPPPSQDEVEPGGDSGKRPMLLAEPVSNAGYGFGGGGGGTSFLPPSLDSDAIADTIKSFFPIAAAAATTSTVPPSIPQPISYHNFPPDLLSRTSSQDLRLSLQSFQDPIFQQPQSTAAPTHHSFFSGSAPMAFDVTPPTWPDQNQRMIQWNVADGGGGGYVFNVPPPQPPPAMPLHPMLGHSQFFTQRGPLQSSNSPSVRAWAADPMPVDHPMHPAFHPSISSIGFASGDGFSGFRIPARIQGEEEHDDDKPSASHH